MCMENLNNIGVLSQTYIFSDWIDSNLMALSVDSMIIRFSEIRHVSIRRKGSRWEIDGCSTITDLINLTDKMPYLKPILKIRVKLVELAKMEDIIKTEKDRIQYELEGI